MHNISIKLFAVQDCPMQIELANLLSLFALPFKTFRLVENAFRNSLVLR